MGIGDEIMVTGRVRRLAAMSGAKRFAIRDVRRGVARWDVMWAGNKLISQPGEPFDEWVDDCPGMRPYILAKTERAWAWKRYGPEPGQIFLTREERAYADAIRGGIVLSPGLKPNASPNKFWPHWQRLIAAAPSAPWVQICAPGAALLTGIRHVITPTFRAACGALAGARAAVFQEGGLHHAAAALGIPTVVIFGSYISPEVTGYKTQENIFRYDDVHPLGCGMRNSCVHCQVAMQGITPVEVLDRLYQVTSNDDPTRRAQK